MSRQGSAVEMPAGGKPGKPKAGFPPFPPSLEISPTPRDFHIPTAPTAAGGGKPKAGFPHRAAPVRGGKKSLKESRIRRIVLTDADQSGKIKRSSVASLRGRSPSRRNRDRHQIGMHDRHRRNTQYGTPATRSNWRPSSNAGDGTGGIVEQASDAGFRDRKTAPGQPAAGGRK